MLDNLAKKLQRESSSPRKRNIPSSLDENQRKQLVDIIQHQFRIELLLKRKELCIIKDRLYRTRQMAKELRDYLPKCRCTKYG
jgi:hypothetical protein